MRWTLLLPFGLAACTLIGGGSGSSSDDDDDDNGWSWGEEESGGEEGDDTGVGPSDEGGSGETGSGEGSDEGGGEGADEGGSGSTGGGSGDVDPDYLEGKSWRTSLADGSWVEPVGLGPLLADYITHDTLIYVSSATGDELRGRVGGAEAGSSTQDECMPTGELTGQLDGDQLSLSSSDPLHLGIEGFPFFFTTYTIEGTLEDEGELLLDATVDGVQDVRVEFWRWEEGAGVTSPSEVCDLMSGFGVGCEPCSDGQEYCISIRVEGLEGNLEGTVVTRSEGC